MLSTIREHALDSDYKTLHGDHQPSSENDQLRALAVLVSQEFGAQTVTVGIVQPWKGMRVQLATFLWRASVYCMARIARRIASSKST